MTSDYISVRNDSFLEQNLSAEEALNFLLRESETDEDTAVVRELSRDEQKGSIDVEPVSMKDLVQTVHQ